MSIKKQGYLKGAMENYGTKSAVHHETGHLPGFDIPAIIDKLRHGKEWLSGEPGSVILLKSDELKVLLTVLHKDTEVISYQSDDSVTFQVLEGSLHIHTDAKSVILEEGELLTLDEKEEYSFETEEETAFLLTLVSEKDENRK